jgi:hypothetical protein
VTNKFPTVPEAFADFEEGLRAYNVWLDRCRNATPPRVVPLRVTKALYSRASIVMIAYYDVSNWPEGPGANPRHPFPPSLAQRISDQMRLLIVGIGRGPIDDLLRQRGNRANGPQELRAQGWAAAYVGAAKAGIINNGKYTKTVAEAFNVSKRAVERWIKGQQKQGIAWRDILPLGMTDDEIPAFLTSRIQEVGREYVEKGRYASPRKPRDPGIPSSKR